MRDLSVQRTAAPPRLPWPRGHTGEGYLTPKSWPGAAKLQRQLIS
jgi:hypothetical protein